MVGCMSINVAAFICLSREGRCEKQNIATAHELRKIKCKDTGPIACTMYGHFVSNLPLMIMKCCSAVVTYLEATSCLADVSPEVYCAGASFPATRVERWIR